MSAKTSIEWTDATWNPTRGCSRVSEGCRNCYAERIAARYSDPGPFATFAERKYTLKTGGSKTNWEPRWTGKVELIESKLQEPLHWRKPRRVFVNSMSDLFHENLPHEAIDRVFAVMASCPQHTFQILTKRPQRMKQYLRATQACAIPGGRSFAEKLPLPNVWLGVSVEDQPTVDERVDLLRQTPAAVRFVSYEPALGSVDFGLFLSELDWVIAGGESGPGARPADVRWFQDVRGQCKAAGIAFFMKQMGTNCTDSLGRMNGAMFDRKGENFEMFPPDLRVREFPSASNTRGPAQLSTTQP